MSAPLYPWKPVSDLAREVVQRGGAYADFVRAVPENEAAQAFVGDLTTEAAKAVFLKNTWDGVARAHAKRQRDKPPALRFLTSTALGELPEPFDFIRGLLHDGQLSVMFGPPGTGKSFLALDMAAHVSLGRPWARCDVDRRDALIIALEGVGGLKRRLRAWSRHHRAEPPLTFGVGFLDLRNPEHVKPIIDQVKATGARFVIVDTVARAMAGGNENDSADMGALIRGADAIREATGAHVCLVTHTGKDESRGARGHSSLKGAADVEIEVSRQGEQRLARVTKSKDGPEGFAIAFVLQPVETDLVDARGERIASAVVVETEKFEDMDEMEERDRDALGILRSLVETNVMVGGDVTLSDWRETAKRRRWGPPPKLDEADPRKRWAAWRKAWSRTVKALHTDGRVSIEGQRVEIAP